MRQLFVAVVAGLAGLISAPAFAADVEVKGPHICCKQCVSAVNKILGAVDGVNNVKPDIKGKSVTFVAKDEAAAKAGIKALVAGGFFGSATCDGKELKVDAPAPAKGEQVKSIQVKNVHACCQQCHTAIRALFKDAKVTIEGTGAQRTVTIEGPGLERSAVIETLRSKGFNGNID
jgi:copper chaperone CopZ